MISRRERQDNNKCNSQVCKVRERAVVPNERRGERRRAGAGFEALASERQRHLRDGREELRAADAARCAGRVAAAPHVRVGRPPLLVLVLVDLRAHTHGMGWDERECQCRRKAQVSILASEEHKHKRRVRALRKVQNNKGRAERTVQTAPFTFSTRWKHLWSERLCRTAF